MSEIEPEIIRESVADAFQQLADKDTFFRLNNAPQVGELIAQNEPGWDIARATAALVLTDATDGYWARTARIVRGCDQPTLGAAKDPEADHLTVDAVMDGLVHRAEKRSEHRTARMISQLSFRSRTRNERMDQNREEIDQHPCIDKRELRASSVNKAKMVFQILGGVALTSPLYESKTARTASIGMMQFGTWLGEVGEKSFRKKVDKLKAESDIQRSFPRPKHLRDRY